MASSQGDVPVKMLNSYLVLRGNGFWQTSLSISVSDLTSLSLSFSF